MDDHKCESDDDDDVALPLQNLTISGTFPSDNQLRHHFKAKWKGTQRDFVSYIQNNLKGKLSEATLCRFLKGEASPTARNALLLYYNKK